MSNKMFSNGHVNLQQSPVLRFSDGKNIMKRHQHPANHDFLK